MHDEKRRIAAARGTVARQCVHIQILILVSKGENELMAGKGLGHLLNHGGIVRKERAKSWRTMVVLQMQSWAAVVERQPDCTILVVPAR